MGKATGFFKGKPNAYLAKDANDLIPVELVAGVLVLGIAAKAVFFYEMMRLCPILHLVML